MRMLLQQKFAQVSSQSRHLWMRKAAKERCHAAMTLYD
jgi:hypothetical protein